MHVHTLPLISQPDLMPHGSGYISTHGILALPRGSALGPAHRISFGEEVTDGFHKNLRVSGYGASISYDSHDLNFSNRLVRTRMPCGVAGAQLTAAPMPFNSCCLIE